MGSRRPPSDEALNEMLTRPRPISLSKDELGTAEPREAVEPVPVEAWVRFPESPIRVSGQALAWTDKAVLVEFQLRSGATHRAWVWASAVERRSRR